MREPQHSVQQSFFPWKISHCQNFPASAGYASTNQFFVLTFHNRIQFSLLSFFFTYDSVSSGQTKLRSLLLHPLFTIILWLDSKRYIHAQQQREQGGKENLQAIQDRHFMGMKLPMLKKHLLFQKTEACSLTETAVSSPLRCFFHCTDLTANKESGSIFQLGY